MVRSCIRDGRHDRGRSDAVGKTTTEPRMAVAASGAAPERCFVLPDSRRIGVATMLVNGLRITEQPAGTPLYVECVYEPSLADPQGKLPKPELCIRDAKGKPLAVKALQLVPSASSENAVRKHVAAIWTLEGGPPPGEYAITIEPQPGLRAWEASLKVVDGPVDAHYVAGIRRRMLSLAGKNDEYMAVLTQLIRQQPDNLALAAEHAQALEASGDRPAAVTAYRSLAARYCRLGIEKNVTHPIPDWLVFKLESLAASIGP